MFHYFLFIYAFTLNLVANHSFEGISLQAEICRNPNHHLVLLPEVKENKETVQSALTLWFHMILDLWAPW